jgi:DNA-binding response OmpR family regulator
MLSTPSRLIVAITDDEARASLVSNLKADGYEPLPASTLAHTRCRLERDIDAVLIDLGSDTVELIDEIREGGCAASVDSWVPIIAGTASNDLSHPVRLLDRGADDVVYEPWLYSETRARLNALLRRADAWRTRQVLRTGELRVNVRARQVWMGDTEIELCGREYDLLRVLATDPDRVFTRSELLETVWGLGDWARTRTLDQHASRLRRKLNDHGGDWIRNVWGVGYRLTGTAEIPV